MAGAVQREQLDLLARLNQRHLDARPGGAELAARIASYELAFRMQAEAPEAVDLARETAETLAMYGVGTEPTDEFGRMPFAEGEGAPGRNHNPYGFTMWLAGGGVKDRRLR